MATAQAGLSVSDPQAYREKMFKLLGDRNPLDVLAQTASALAAHHWPMIPEWVPGARRPCHAGTAPTVNELDGLDCNANRIVAA